jgi:hypothetical protein
MMRRTESLPHYCIPMSSSNPMNLVPLHHEPPPPLESDLFDDTLEAKMAWEALWIDFGGEG